MSDADAALQGNDGLVPAGTCPGGACLNLSVFGFVGGGGCLCDGAALAAVHRDATHARRELVYTLIGAPRLARVSLTLSLTLTHASGRPKSIALAV